MSHYISEALAEEILIRSGGRCEYCRISIEDTYFGSEIDHIRSLKHGGITVLNNLALACQPCNRKKGTDLGSVSIVSGDLIRFFNPRTDTWNEHFRAEQDGRIEVLTEVGEVTVRILGCNDPERIAERKGLIELNRYVILDNAN